MEVHRFTPDRAETWDTFVGQSRNGTLFHTRRFLGYHPAGRFEDHSLLISSEGKPLAVLPAAAVMEGGKKILKAHPGATHGGLVLSPKCGSAATWDVVTALLAHIQREGFSGASLLRITPAPLRRMFADDLEYALLGQGCHLTRCELGSVIDLRGISQESLLSSFDTQCRNEVRQAERAGVIVRICTDYPAYYPLLEATLGHRHDVRPTHTLEELQKLAALFPHAQRLFGAFAEDKLIAGIVTVDLTENAVYTKYMAQDYAFQKKRSLNLLLAEVLRTMLHEGKTVLDLGVSMEETEPNGINEGLFAFKEGFGARPVCRESWKISL